MTTTEPPTPAAPAPLSDERLAAIESRAVAATVCPEAQVNGRQDGRHTWGGSSFTHTECQLCRFTRPRGERAEETAELLAEVHRLRRQKSFLIEQLRRKDAQSGEADRKVREFLGAEPAVEDLAAADNPTHLRWGLDDVLWGDDDSVIVLMSDRDRRPYWLELEADRAAALRRNLAGPGGEHAADDETGTRPCGHDDYHAPHEWADRPGVWCGGISHADDEAVQV